MGINPHLIVKDLGLSRLRLGNQGIIQNLEDILTDLFQLILDLLTVVTDDGNVFFGALGFLLLFDGGDDPPGGTPSTNHVFVRDGKQVSLINRKLTIHLDPVSLRGRGRKS